jgi:nucleoside 2-deoxyribosyltransferase
MKISKHMTAYISISSSRRILRDREVKAIVETLSESKITSSIFVDIYKFDPSQEQQMMQQAMAGIDKCDLLIAEVSDKAIGIGVEVGYAKGIGKPIVYMRGQGAEHSTTVSGMSDFQILYKDTADLQKQLTAALGRIKMPG